MRQTRSQKKAATHFGGHALVLAGPGTGKTSTLIERIAFLISKGVPLESLFITTFTQKAAEEIKNRLSERLGIQKTNKKIIDSAYIGTFHSLCARILKQYPGEALLPYDFKIIGEDEQFKILNSLGHEWDSDEGNFIEVISNWKDQLLTDEQIKAYCKKTGSQFLLKASSAYFDYEKEKKILSLIDFSDIIRLTSQLLTSESEASKWFFNRFSHFIVDEFQDVNKNQVDFIKKAIRNYATLWAVADEDQSIYEWRGSDPRYCLNFQKIFGKAEIYFLEENFRCPPIVVKLAKNFILNNNQRYDKSIKAFKSATKNDLVVFKGFENDELEAKWITSMVLKYKEHNKSLNQIVILSRTNQLTTSIERKLETNNIPFNIIGLKSFWEMTEVISFIKAVKDINKSGVKVKNPSDKTHLAKELFYLSKELEGLPLRNCANAIANKIYEKMPKNLEKDRRENWLSNTEAILNIALDIDDSEKFMDFVDSKINRQAYKDNNKVTISTIHAAKGLEWDIVFLIGVEEETIPHYKTKSLEEERRLFYVALTRAKQNFISSYTYSRKNKAKKPSRFLWETTDDIRSNLSNFVWKDPNRQKTEETSKDVVPTNTRSNSQRDIKSTTKRKYRHKGGKSLISPEDRDY